MSLNCKLHLFQKPWFIGVAMNYGTVIFGFGFGSLSFGYNRHF